MGTYINGTVESVQAVVPVEKKDYGRLKLQSKIEKTKRSIIYIYINL
jgi:hypothetical protein